jgi:hypothetical protein
MGARGKDFQSPSNWHVWGKGPRQRERRDIELHALVDAGRVLLGPAPVAPGTERHGRAGSLPTPGSFLGMLQAPLPREHHLEATDFVRQGGETPTLPHDRPTRPPPA